MEIWVAAIALLGLLVRITGAQGESIY